MFPIIKEPNVLNKSIIIILTSLWSLDLIPRDSFVKQLKSI